MREDWVECKLEDLLNYTQPNKFRVKSTKYDPKYKTPVLTPGKSFILGYTNEKEGIFRDIPCIIFDDFTTATKFVNFDFKVKSSAMKILTPTSKLVNLKFVYSYMQTIRKNTDTHKRYWISIFAKLTCPIPPLPEQRAIVAKLEALFSALDNGIANLQKAKEQITIYRQAVLKQAFEGKLTKAWRAQQSNLPTADELLAQIKEERAAYYEQQINEWKETVEEWEAQGKEGRKPRKPRKLKEFPELSPKELKNLPNLPSKWLYNYLAYAGVLARGKSKHRPRNDSKLFGGDYPFIQTAEVKAQNKIIKYDKTYNELGLAQSKLWKKGTLCITIAANIAETGFLGLDACFPDSIVGFTPFSKITSSSYIDYFIVSIKQKINQWAPATAQKNINLTILENIVVPFPSLQEQKQIVQEIESRLSVCDQAATEIEAGLVQAEALRQSILKQAFEGKLLNEQELAACRQAPDWEPAQDLLARIKKEKKAAKKSK